MNRLILWTLVLLTTLAACKNNGSLTSSGVPEPATPVCILEKIKEFNKLGEKYRPKFIMRYSYKGKTVYYIPSRCCDVPAEVFDENCVLICQPEGGITGKGDGKCPDFKADAKDGKVIWENGQ